MKILFLVESINNKTVQNLLTEMNTPLNQVDVIPYFEGGIDQCEIDSYEGLELVKYQGRPYLPAHYDIALLWSWGTAPLGRKYLRVFESQGVMVINSTHITEMTDSKVNMMRKFKEQGIAIPDTILFEDGFEKEDIKFSQLIERLGEPPYIFKADYSTQGGGVRFVHTEEQLHYFAKELANNSPENKGFVLQRFIGEAENPIAHYRVLVLGDNVFPFAMKVTAQEPLKVSNVAAGGEVNLTPLTAELRSAAINAAKVAGLSIAGVDLMIECNNHQQNIVVLEVNDGPGTKTFDKEGCNASKAVVDYIYYHCAMMTKCQQMQS